jgi:hypothetical protein
VLLEKGEQESQGGFKVIGVFLGFCIVFAYSMYGIRKELFLLRKNLDLVVENFQKYTLVEQRCDDGTFKFWLELDKDD